MQYTEFNFIRLLKKALPSREETNISLSIMNSKTCLHLFILMHYARILSPKHTSMLNTRSNDFICRHIEHVTHVSLKIPSGAAVSGEGGVAVEGKLVGVPKFHS